MQPGRYTDLVILIFKGLAFSRCISLLIRMHIDYIVNSRYNILQPMHNLYNVQYAHSNRPVSSSDLQVCFPTSAITLYVIVSLADIYN